MSFKDLEKVIKGLQDQFIENTYLKKIIKYIENTEGSDWHLNNFGDRNIYSYSNLKNGLGFLVHSSINFGHPLLGSITAYVYNLDVLNLSFSVTEPVKSFQNIEFYNSKNIPKNKSVKDLFYKIAEKYDHADMRKTIKLQKSYSKKFLRDLNKIIIKETFK